MSLITRTREGGLPNRVRCTNGKATRFASETTPPPHTCSAFIYLRSCRSRTRLGTPFGGPARSHALVRRDAGLFRVRFDPARLQVRQRLGRSVGAGATAVGSVRPRRLTGQRQGRQVLGKSGPEPWRPCLVLLSERGC